MNSQPLEKLIGVSTALISRKGLLSGLPSAGNSEVLPTGEYYRERDRKIRRVLGAHFGKQHVSVTPGWVQGRVTARIDCDLGTGELIDLVRNLLVDAGITVRMAGLPVDVGADPLDAAAESYLWVRHRFDEAGPPRPRSSNYGR